MSLDKKNLWVFFALFLVACAGKPPSDRKPASEAWQGPAQVLIIRHGEKPRKGNNLSPAGYARAQALVSVFESNSSFLTYGTPAAIYAMAPDSPGASDDTGTMRPIETVTPLVQSLRETDPSLDFVDIFRKKDTVQAADAVRRNRAYAGKMVLMCWEHDAIENLLTTFGVSPLPKPWRSSVFGRVLEVNFNHDGSFKDLRCLTELPADSRECAGFSP